jgi:hypothetical protein
MSVAYEPRSFISEPAYPSMGDDHDHHHHEQRYTDNDVAEQLSQYTREASLLPDDTDVMGDDQSLLPDDPDAGVVDEGTRLEDLTVDTFPSPLRVSLPPPSLPDPATALKSDSPREDSPSARPKGMPKPDRDVTKQDDGKFHCPLADCKEDVRAFSRKCEWKYVHTAPLQTFYRVTER